MFVVTGASGHLGANLVRMLLDRGDSVRAMVHHEAASLDGLPVERVAGDILDEASLRAAFSGAQVVVHLAALISITGSQGGRVETLNVQGARHAARAARSENVRRFIHVSSVHAFHHAPEEAVRETGARPAPTAPAYDRSKAAGEDEVRIEIEQGLDAVIVNPSGVIGPFDFGPSRFGQSLVQMANGRIPALVEGGFDWVDARDVSTAILAAVDRGRTGEGYLLGGRWASVAEIAGMVADFTGVAAPRFSTPRWLASAVAPLAAWGQAAMGQEPLFTPEGLHALFHGSRKVDWSKAAKELGHAPRPLADTVHDTLSWFRATGRIP
jgi:dihydroflavonol-4-reductase